MDKVVVVFCIFLILLAFYLVIRNVIRQLRGGKCAGCPLNEGNGCSSCGKKRSKSEISSNRRGRDAAAFENGSRKSDSD